MAASTAKPYMPALRVFAGVASLGIASASLARSAVVERGPLSLMFANADSWQHYPWIGVDEEHHELSHAGDDDSASNEKLVTINTWHSQQIAYILDKLEATPEADGSNMLDNTLLLWGNELGAGKTHTYKDIPWLLAGGAGGYFKMGRYLAFKDQPHNNLLVSACNAMGFDVVSTFGIPGVCTGALSGLTA